MVVTFLQPLEPIGQRFSSTHGSRQVKEKDVGKFEPNEQGLV
jgi:hypothetical protein